MRLLNTGHFTFWDDLTKVAVTIVRDRRFNWNLVFWLPMNGALLTRNFVRSRCCLLELRKCTDHKKVYLCNGDILLSIIKFLKLNLVVALKIYWRLCVRNFIYTCLGLTFLLLFPHTVYMYWQSWTFKIQFVRGIKLLSYVESSFSLAFYR